MQDIYIFLVNWLFIIFGPKVYIIVKKINFNYYISWGKYVLIIFCNLITYIIDTKKSMAFTNLFCNNMRKNKLWNNNMEKNKLWNK